MLFFDFLFRMWNMDAGKRQMQNRHHVGGWNGRFENPGRFKAGTRTTGRSDFESGAAGSRARKAPGTSAIMDARSEEARPARWQQEPGQRTKGRLGCGVVCAVCSKEEVSGRLRRRSPRFLSWDPPICRAGISVVKPGNLRLRFPQLRSRPLLW